VNTIPTLAPICPLRSASPRSQTVLVVDDFAPVCDLVAWHLFAIGYHVLTAHDPVEAQRMILSATDSEIDLLLTDFELPKMRGDELAEWCGRERPQTALTEALIDDPRVSVFQIHSTVADGIATLGGVVDNLKTKKAAEEDARDTTGVWGVENHIKVRPLSFPSDSELSTRVKEALLRNSLTAAPQIDVQAIHGTAYLSGLVNSDYVKETAADVAYQAPGVVDVENNIIVGPDAGIASMSDWEIKANIEMRFNFSPRLDSSRINVSVVDGVASLKGVVENLLARQTAVDLARRAGARKVHDELLVKTGPT
jgi:osmotically-inducible protein OsmY